MRARRRISSNNPTLEARRDQLGVPVIDRRPAGQHEPGDHPGAGRVGSPAAAGVAVMLAGQCPRVPIMTTSRERLDVPGEFVFPVPPLGLPEDGSAGAVAASEAGSLFVTRAHAASPGFTLTDGTAAAVAEVCSRLDDMPLAIELAATRCPALGPAQLAARLEGHPAQGRLHWPGRSPTARPRCWPASVRACPTRGSRPGCTCPKPGSRATSRGCWTSWAAPTAPRPACSPATPRYRQPVARVGEAAGWNSGWVPGRLGCVLRPDVRARRVRRASRARREPAAVAIMSLTRLVASCCRISGWSAR